jgi:hypothetical protein
MLKSSLLQKGESQALVEFARKNLNRIKTMFQKPMGYQEVEKLLVDEMGLTQEVAELVAPVVNQRVDKTLNEAAFKRALDVVLSSPVVRNLEKQADEEDEIWAIPEPDIDPKRVAFFQLLRKWFGGDYIGVANVPKELTEGLRGLGHSYPDTTLYRFCHLKKTEVEHIVQARRQQDDVKTSVKTAARSVQSWAETHNAARNFVEMVTVDNGYPERDYKTDQFVILCARIPSHCILIRVADLLTWVTKSDWPELEQPFMQGSSSTWRRTLDSQISGYDDEKEWIIDLDPSTVLPVLGLDLGFETNLDGEDEDAGMEWEWRKAKLLNKL